MSVKGLLTYPEETGHLAVKNISVQLKTGDMAENTNLGALEGSRDMTSRESMISFELEVRKSQGQHG